MIKKPKETFAMIIVATLMIIILCAASYIVNNQNNSIDTTETSQTNPTKYLEIHFGNGEVYKQEADFIVSPYSGTKAKLSNGYIYNLETGYKYSYNKETNTYVLYVWRDEPYTLEKELFEKIE